MVIYCLDLLGRLSLEAITSKKWRGQTPLHRRRVQFVWNVFFEPLILFWPGAKS
jgi:hypothetical protein